MDYTENDLCYEIKFENCMKAGADPGLILGCCKILQKNLLQYDASNQEDFTVDYFDQSFIKSGILWHWHE